jgi:DNA replication regulator SLD3
MNENGEVTVQIRSSKNQYKASLMLLGDVPLNLSRLASLIVHTRSSQANAEIAPINENKSRIFHCTDESMLHVIRNRPSLVKITLNSRDQYGIASILDSTHIIINYLSSVQQQNGQSFQSILVSEDFINQWSTRTQLYGEKKNDLNLLMAPPFQNSPVQAIDKEDNINDPLDYFMDRYFSNLYFLTTPLTFFTKSAFSKLKSLCLNDIKFYESILSQFIISLGPFDTRHAFANNGLLNSASLFETEEIYRNDFISKSLNLVDFDIHSTDYAETNRSLSTTLNNFKVREIQLQILILFELIHITERDDTKLFERASKSNIRKRLVGKRRVTPVINGMAITVDNEPPNKDPLTVNQLLDVYIDKLAINDLLNGSSSSEHYSPKFINYVVVPFFDKKCPNSVRHMIKKIKGPSFKRSTVNYTEKTKAAKFKRPLIQRSNSSQIKLEDIAELKPSLSRSNSDLESIKRSSSFNTNPNILSKREIDMSIPVPSESKPMKKINSQIFSRVGKITTSTSSLKITESYRQVEATPVKKTKIVDVINTPDEAQAPDSVKSVVVRSGPDENIIVSSPVAMRTPMTLRSPITLRSNSKRPGEPLDFKGLATPVTKNVRRQLFPPSHKREK